MTLEQMKVQRVSVDNIGGDSCDALASHYVFTFHVAFI
jgi:hypothetical protein